MAAKLFHLPFPTAFNSNGLAVPGAQLYFYLTGTTTPSPTYTTSDLTTEHEWPVEANGAGRFPSIYLDDGITYRLIIRDAIGNTLDDVDPHIPGTLVGGAKGDPGGNVMAIGTFTAAAGMDIDAGTDLVQTSAYSAPVPPMAAVGAALYIHDEEVDAAYVVANPRTAFLADDGRGFRLSPSQTLTPYMFGALGTFAPGGNWYLSGLTEADFEDDTEAWQALTAFTHGHHVSVDWSGIWGVSDTIVFGGTGNEQPPYDNTAVYSGSAVFVVLEDIPGPVLHVRGPEHCMMEQPVVTGIGIEQLDWDLRKFDTGILVENRAAWLTLGSSRVHFARFGGLVFQSPNNGTDNSFAAFLGNHYSYGCGSGALSSEAPQAYLTSTYTGVTNPVTSPDMSQRSRLSGVATFPPERFEDDYQDFDAFVMLPGSVKIYKVEAMDRGAGTIDIFPLKVNGIASSGTFRWIFGAGVQTMGGDSGVIRGNVVCNACGIGIRNAALYPGKFNATIQTSAIGYMVGKNTSSPAVGGGLDPAYFEGHDCDIFWNAGQNEHHKLLNVHIVSLAKVQFLAPRYFSGGTVGLEIGGNNPTGLEIDYYGSPRRTITKASETLYNGQNVDFKRPVSDVVALFGDSVTITFERIATVDNADSDAEVERVFGRLVRLITVDGTGADNKPTGTITIDPPAEWGVNGGAAGVNATFNTFTGPVLILAALDNTTTPPNLRISFLGGK